MIQRVRGFTLIELFVAMLSLALIFAAGSQVDLVDLVDRPTFFKANVISTDVTSLIQTLEVEAEQDFTSDVIGLADVTKRPDALERLRQGGHRALPALEEAANSDSKDVRDAARRLLPAAQRAARERKLMVEVVCHELGERRVPSARSVLERLAEDPDYFVSKHAKNALAMIQQEPSKGSENLVVPKDIQQLLPGRCNVIVSLPGDHRSNLQSLFRNLSPEKANALVAKVNAAIGNFDISKVQVLRYDNPGNPGNLFLVIASGRYYQDAVAESLVGLGAQATQSTEKVWVGRLATATVVMIESRYVVVSLERGAGPLDEGTVLKIAEAVRGSW